MWTPVLTAAAGRPLMTAADDAIRVPPCKLVCVSVSGIASAHGLRKARKCVSAYPGRDEGAELRVLLVEPYQPSGIAQCADLVGAEQRRQPEGATIVDGVVTSGHDDQQLIAARAFFSNVCRLGSRPQTHLRCVLVVRVIP